MASTSSSSQPSSYRQYYVFLSHRGPDVKNTLASHIYHTLARCGVSVFLDKYQMEPGERIPAQIKDAISNASLHIPIFSKGYAASRWCLEELCWMMESPTKILPVFYDVEPSDLSSKDGLYAKALQTLEEQKGDGGTPKYDTQTIKQWKKALSDVRIRSGLELKTFSGDEGELVKNIVDNVLIHVRRTLPYVSVDHPVGLSEEALHFEEEMLSRPAPNVHVVGIVGMGGSGKTTLAAHIFSSKRSNYDKSCRLFDVRSHTSLTDLQSKLLADLTDRNEKIYSVREGIEMLKSRVRPSCQALVMLDDIDHVDQLEALLVVRDALGSGSLILLTSRDKGLLEHSQISSIYNIRELSEQDAQKLFCWHAFLRPFPSEGYEDLVKNFLIVCNGLPLSLKVFGALLCGHDDDKVYWEHQLGRISEILDEHNIKGKLKVSYDALGNNIKEMFLDTACFFIGVDKSSAVKIWEGCRWNGSHGFETLEKRCLVGLDEQNRIKMHGHLRDLGREMAKEDPSKPRRLCQPEDINDLLERRYTTMQVVRGIHSTDAPRDFPFYDEIDGPPRIMKWRRWIRLVGNCVLFWCRPKCGRSDAGGLKLLVIKGDSIRGILGNSSCDLLWLRWHQCPYPTLPPWLSMDKLRVLELIGGHFQTLWLACQKQIPIQLRELTMIGTLAKFPKSIGALKHLEKIALNRSDSIKSLPDEFCGLRSLRYLQLNHWIQLRSLPEGLGKLTNLQCLDLSGCSNLQRLPTSFSRLLQLRHLLLWGCSRLMIGEDFLGDISTLEHVDFQWCDELKMLPTRITRQASLKELNLKYTSLMELPNEIGDLNNLKVLRLASGLKSLPPSIWKLSGLTTLQLQSCTLLNSLPERGVGDEGEDPGEEYSGGIDHLKSLENFEIYNGPLLGNVVPFTSVLGKDVDSKEPGRLLHNLKYLTLVNTKISNISLTEDICPNLQHVNLSRNSHLVEVEVSLRTLERLNLSDCTVLKRITGLSFQAKLSDLDISSCDELEDLPDLGRMSCLKHLNVNRCWKLNCIRGAAHLRSLKRLEADGCFGLQSIVGLGQLELLGHLQISAGNGAIWNSIEFLKRMPSYKLSTATLTTRTVGRVESGVESILNSVSLPFTLLKYSMNKLELPDDLKSCSGVIMCFVLRTSSTDSFLEIDYRNMSHRVYTKDGEWLNASIFTRDSAYAKRICVLARKNGSGGNFFEVYTYGRMAVKKGWMVIGSANGGWEADIAQVWNKLIHHICSDCSLCSDL